MTSTARLTASRRNGEPQAGWIRTAETLVFAAFLLGIGLAFSQTIQIQFTLPKLLWLRFGAAALAMFWARRLWTGQLRPVPAFIVAPALLLVAWWIITTPFAADPPTAVHGLRGRYNGLINQTILIALFLAVASLAESRQTLRGLVMLIVAALVPVAMYAVAQDLGFDPFVWPNPRPGSTIGHPVPLAAILSLAIPFVIAFLLTEKNSNTWWAWALVLVLFLFAAAATLSRGPWAGLIVASAIVVIAAVRLRVIGLRGRAAWLVAIAFIAALVPLLDSGAVSRVSQRLRQLAALDADPSVAGRFVYYDAALRMIRDRPIIGVGLENFAVLYPRYRPFEGETIPPDAVPTMVHNGYLQAAATTGLPGLALYLSLMTGLMIVVVRGARGKEVRLKADTTYADTTNARDGMVGVAFAAAIAGYLVQDLSGWQEMPLSVLFWTIAGTGVAYANAGSAAARPIVRGTWRTAAVGGVVLGGALMFALGLETRRAMAVDAAFFESHLLDPIRDWPRIQANLGVGLRLAGDDPYYQDSAGVLYLKRFHAAGDSEAYKRSASLFEQARQKNRHDPYILLHRIDLESAALQRKLKRSPTDTVGRAVAAALDMDPNNASVHETVARFRFAEGQLTGAIASIEQAIALRPGHPRFHALQGDVLRGIGDRGRASAAYQEETRRLVRGSPEWLNAEHRLMVTLAEAGHQEAVIEEGRSVLAAASGDHVSHVLVGLAYLALNQRDLARESLEQALKLKPDDPSALEGLRGLTSNGLTSVSKNADFQSR